MLKRKISTTDICTHIPNVKIYKNTNTLANIMKCPEYET